MAGDFFWYINGYNAGMKTMKTFRNILLLLWFGWFALAGITITGLLVWLTPWSMSGLGILLTGSLAGILVGVLVAAILLYALWRRIGAPLVSAVMIVRMLREKMFQMNSSFRM
jgi:hypothetical protein